MITKVEVTLKKSPMFGEAHVCHEKIISFDTQGNKKEHKLLIEQIEYTSASDLITAISQKLAVDKKKININDSDVIENDEDTLEQDRYKDGSLYPYDMPEEVDIREEKMSIFEWLRKLKRGSLLLNPEFQRHLVWNDTQKSRFIESVLLNIPLPPFYVNQDKSGKYTIVDGLQRTTTFKDFKEDQSFKLQELQVLKNLNGKNFDDLEPTLKTKIEDKQLFVYVIKQTVPIALVYDIFNRINTGGTQLNRQEIRNCIFIGEATRLLKRLSEKRYFKDAIDYGISSLRMKDREAILRYLSFKTFDYDSKYDGDMDEFLAETMKKINTIEKDEITKLETDFERVMKRTFEFFGTKNFRLATSKSRGKIIIAMMESIGHFFSNKTDSFLDKHKDKIIRNYSILIKNDEYIRAVSQSTGNKNSVLKRFRLAHKILGEV